MIQLEDRLTAAEQVEISEATIEDLDRIAALHLECLRPRANLASLFGPGFVRAAYQWFLTAKDTYVIKATIGGEFAGFTSICDTPYSLPMLMACRKQALRSLVCRPWLLINPRIVQRLWRRPGGTGLKQTGPGIAQVGFTAVSPRYRGRGVGSSLKVASIRISCERGSRGLLTGISRENRASIALNERFGFREIEEAATPRYRYYILRFAGSNAIAADEPDSTHEHPALHPNRGEGRRPTLQGS